MDARTAVADGTPAAASPAPLSWIAGLQRSESFFCHTGVLKGETKGMLIVHFVLKNVQTACAQHGDASTTSTEEEGYATQLRRRGCAQPTAQKRASRAAV